MTTTKLDAALEYASHGDPVFLVWHPEGKGCGCGALDCKSPGKHPISRCTPNGLKGATTDAALLTRWYEWFPRANLAMRTGITCTVLDIDRAKGGAETMEQLAAKHGHPGYAEGVDGGDGWHLHFAPVPGLGNSAGKIGPGVDVRGEEGYVVLPPSTHVSGGSYRDDPDAAMYELPRAPMPGWLAALAMNHGSRIGNGAALHRSQDEWATKLAGAPEGQRRAVALELAGHFLGLGISVAEVETILLGYAARCVPPFPEREARTLVGDLARRDSVRASQSTDTARQTPASAGPITEEAPEETAPRPGVAAEPVEVIATDRYVFSPAFPAPHFVADFITYASARTDAALEYLEATGLVVLDTAMPNVRAALAQYLAGLPTNLYVLLIGDSTKSRKSTAKNIGRDLLGHVIPDSLLADQASPEAFIEQLAGRSGTSSDWFVDEMGETIEKLHHAKYLAGLRGLLLQLYEGGDYRYHRTTKRIHGKRVRDVLEIERAHLSILGATTPSIFDTLTGRDVESGFLGRFSIIMPTSKPPRRPFFLMRADMLATRNDLVRRLHAVYTWARTARPVEFAPGTLEQLDAFAAELETAAETADDRAKALLHRLSAMAIKVAMLSAGGRPDIVNGDTLRVTPADVDSALIVARRWSEYAIAFASRVGDTEFEKALARCLRHAQQLARQRGPRVLRRDIARKAHLSKRELDNVQDTLRDRGAIQVETTPSQSGPEAVFWVVGEGSE